LEIHDLAKSPRHAARVDQLTALLRDWQRRVGDAQPLTVANPRPLEIHFDGYVRKPDPWQPAWIVDKYF
jgi:hypothetical protein